MTSGRLVCRCHDVLLWCYVYFVLLRFRLYAFVEAAALSSIVLRYAGAPLATVFFLDVSFSRVFFVPFPLSLCMESTSYVLFFRMVFFYLVTTGWIFDICLQSINQSKCQNRRLLGGKNYTIRYYTGKADCYGNEKRKRKWPKSVCFFWDQKNGRSQSYGNGFVLAWFRQLV